jgi:hypothetical protein
VYDIRQRGKCDDGCGQRRMQEVNAEDEGQDCEDKCRTSKGNADNGVSLGRISGVRVWSWGLCLDCLGLPVDLHCLFR